MQPSRLEIVKGLTPMVGTTATNETGREVLNLLNIKNISLMENGWTPAYAGLKNGGTWAESAITPSSELIAYSEDRVNEVMRFNVTGADDKDRYFMFSKLARLGRAARDQHVSDHQFNPVSLCVQLPSEPGPRFAQLLDIEFAQTSPEPAQSNIMTYTVTLIREPFWVWEVAPGDSPKWWTFYKRSVTPTNSNWSLQGATSPQYIQGTIANITSYKNTGDTFWYTGYLEIPAADIPGDAPALVQLHMGGAWNAAQHYLHSIFIGRSSKQNAPYLVQNLAAKTSAANPYIVTLGTDTTNEADNGCIDNGQSSSPGWGASNNNRAKVAFTTLNYAKRLTWGVSILKNTGTYAVFGRCLQSGGAQDDIKMYLQYGASNYSPIVTEEVSPVLQTISTDTEFWPLTYFGVIRLPVDDTSMLQSPLISGAGNVGHIINLYAKRLTATGTPTLYFADLILMPIEDGLVEINFEDAAVANGSSYFITDVYYDSTRYLSRGRATEIAGSIDGGGALEVAGQIKGPALTLTPGVTNRLYFLFTSSDQGVTPTIGRSSIVSDPGGGAGRGINTVTVSANIVPRSIGPRYE